MLITVTKEKWKNYTDDLINFRYTPSVIKR